MGIYGHQCYSSLRSLMQFFKLLLFYVSKMTSAGLNHLIAEEVCQSVCYSSRFTHLKCDFSRCVILKIVVVVGEVGQSSSFCKHTTSMRWVPYTRCPLFSHKVSMYAQLGHNTMIGELYYNYCGTCKWCNLWDCSVVYLLVFWPRLPGVVTETLDRCTVTRH